MLRATNTGMTAMIDARGRGRGESPDLTPRRSSRRGAGPHAAPRRTCAMATVCRLCAASCSALVGAGARRLSAQAAAVSLRSALPAATGRMPRAFRTLDAHLPADHPPPAGVLGSRRAARCCSPTTWRWAPAPRTRRPSCARSDPSPGARPTCSPRAAPRTAATARTRTACNTTTSTRWCSSPRRWTSSSCICGSLEALGIDPLKNDIRFVEDDWENPTLGAWGLGWEVWMNGMEVTQFTYFQQVGGLECKPITGEITYGLERLACTCRASRTCSTSSTRPGRTAASTGRLPRRLPPERGRAEPATTSSSPTPQVLLGQFNLYETEAKRLMRGRTRAARLRDGAEGRPHLQPARRARRDRVTERAAYIGRIRTLARSSRRATTTRASGSVFRCWPRRRSGGRINGHPPRCSSS